MREKKKKPTNANKKKKLFEERLEARPLNDKEKALLVKVLSIPGLSQKKPPKGQKTQPDDFAIPYSPDGKTVVAEEVIARFQYINDIAYKNKGPSDKLNMHHLRPVWAGGTDSAMNLWIAPAGHQKPRGYGTLKKYKSLIALRNASTGKYDNIHDWWAYSLFWELNKNLPKKTKYFLKLPPKYKIHLDKNYIGKYTENNITKIAEKLSKASPPKKFLLIYLATKFANNDKSNISAQI